MKYVMIWLIRLYQKFISPLKPGCCRFTPTCSQYAVEAFRKRGFFIGLILTVYRILRCNPFCAPGYDPVPDKKIPKYRREKTAESKNNEDNDK
jgi:putative membrane protein insertion efficiency factor